MTIDDKRLEMIRDWKLQYDIKREVAKVSTLLSGKVDKYEYPTSEEILPCNQKQIIELAKFTYFPLGKTFEKQTKTIEDEGKRQIDAITNHNRLEALTNNKRLETLTSKGMYNKYIW